MNGRSLSAATVPTVAHFLSFLFSVFRLSRIDATMQASKLSTNVYFVVSFGFLVLLVVFRCRFGKRISYVCIESNSNLKLRECSLLASFTSSGRLGSKMLRVREVRMIHACMCSAFFSRDQNVFISF